MFSSMKMRMKRRSEAGAQRPMTQTGRGLYMPKGLMIQPLYIGSEGVIPSGIASLSV